MQHGKHVYELECSRNMRCNAFDAVSRTSRYEYNTRHHANRKLLCASKLARRSETAVQVHSLLLVHALEWQPW
jgi:hypothetical protein